MKSVDWMALWWCRMVMVYWYNKVKGRKDCFGYLTNVMGSRVVEGSMARAKMARCQHNQPTPILNHQPSPT